MKRLTIIERVIAIMVSMAAVAFMTYTVYTQFNLYKQRTLYYQLQILRMGINIYQFVNHKNPEKLGDMINKTYHFPGERVEWRYVEGLNINSKGDVVDPFGNPYSYDPMTSWVRSTTPGYEFW